MRKRNAEKKKKNEENSRTCPHCNKILTRARNLRNHVQKSSIIVKKG
jgi:uncharacterized C2H2 Zn-finger protein